MDDDKVAKLLGQLRDAVAERIAGLNRPLIAEEQAITAQVERCKQFACQLQLPSRLFAIYREVVNYHFWAREHPENVCSLITEVTVRKNRAVGWYRVEEQVQFSLKSHRYSFLFEEKRGSSMPGDDDTLYASLTLAGSNNNDVLFQERMRSLGGLGWNVHKLDVSSINSFVPGEWVVDFIELSEAIAGLTLERDHRNRKSEIERQRQDFGLNLPDAELHKLQVVLGERSSTEDPRSTVTSVHTIMHWLRQLFGRYHSDRSQFA
jgi:hypothetical protein